SAVTPATQQAGFHRVANTHQDQNKAVQVIRPRERRKFAETRPPTEVELQVAIAQEAPNEGPMIRGVQDTPQGESVDSPRQNALDQQDSVIGEHVASNRPLTGLPTEEHGPRERDRGPGLSEIEAPIGPRGQAS